MPKLENASFDFHSLSIVIEFNLFSRRKTLSEQFPTTITAGSSCTMVSAACMDSSAGVRTTVNT